MFRLLPGIFDIVAPTLTEIRFGTNFQRRSNSADIITAQRGNAKANAAALLSSVGRQDQASQDSSSLRSSE